MGKEVLVSAENLSFSFNDNPVLKNVSFRIERNSFVSFIGPSGCGKTTLLNLIAGIYKSDSSSLLTGSRNVSFVFQDDTLLPWRNTIKNVLLPFELSTPPDRNMEDKAMRMLNLVQLSGCENYMPHQLSGGMKKRVEIARALVTEPELLILDEPFSSLDIITGEKLNVLIKKICEETGVTTILVTHSVEEACFLSKKIYVMSNLPSSIIKTEIIDKTFENKDRFILSDAELKTDKSIREDARSLWSRQNDGVNSKPGKSAGRKLPGGLKVKNILFFPAQILFLFFVLTLIKYVFKIKDFIFPYPADIFLRMRDTLANGFIIPHIQMTIFESISGFIIAFIVTLILGIIIAKFKIISKLLMPYLVAANTIPSVALAPFLVLWFGFGVMPRIITSIIVIFFPMLVNNISAINMAESATGKIVSFYSPPFLKRFIKFEFPAALPFIFSGVKVSITLSVIGAVVGEFVSGGRGLGFLVRSARATHDTELMFVGLVWLILLGLLYFSAANLLYTIVSQGKDKKGEF